MCAHVVMAGSQSSSFPVEVGVKQRCIPAPTIFNLYLVAMTLVSNCDVQPSDCVEVEYRPDCGLLTLRCLQARTNTCSSAIAALWYADDAALTSLAADGLQRSPDVIYESCLRASLIVNTTKTEVLSTSSPDVQTFSISGKQPNNLENFIYFLLFYFYIYWVKICHFLVT